MLTAQQNLVQLEEIVEFLTEWRSNCKSGLAQGSRGATRLRGFITEELFNAFQLDLASFKFIVEFAVNNAYDVAKLRNTPPFSASNETQHGILRLKSRKMVISTVARSAAQVMECSRILSDNVRTFHTGIGLGTRRTPARLITTRRSEATLLQSTNGRQRRIRSTSD